MTTVLQLKQEEIATKWHRSYMNRLIEVAKLTEAQAQEALDAGMGEYNYSTPPESSADEEMSYWTE